MLVSHWAVNSDAMVRFITNAFDELNSNPAIGRAGALRGSAMIETAGGYEHPRIGRRSWWWAKEAGEIGTIVAVELQGRDDLTLRSNLYGPARTRRLGLTTLGGLRQIWVIRVAKISSAVEAKRTWPNKNATLSATNGTRPTRLNSATTSYMDSNEGPL
jgi:hypothetical protein